MTDRVAEFDTVLLLVNDGTRQFAEVQRDRTVRLRKGTFPSIALNGVEYGAVYELLSRAPKGASPLKLIESGELLPSVQVETGSGADNRNLVDSGNAAQALSADDLAKLKAEGADGTAILSALIGGSATFAGKTAFSQEKWLKKKGAKHVQRFRVVRTSPLNIAETAMLKHASKIGGLRWDALAMMLTHGDVRSGCTALVFDGVSGLLTASVAHRMGCKGAIVAAHAKDEGGPLLGYLPKLNLGSTAAGNSASPTAAAVAAIVDSSSHSSSSSSSSSAAAGSAADGSNSSSSASVSSAAAVTASSSSGLSIVGVSYRQLTSWAEEGPVIIRPHAASARGEAAQSSEEGVSSSIHNASGDTSSVAQPSDAETPNNASESNNSSSSSSNSDSNGAHPKPAGTGAGHKRKREASSSSSSSAGAAAEPAPSPNPHIVRPARLSDLHKRALLFGAVHASIDSGSSNSGTITPGPGGVDCVLIASGNSDPLPLLLAAVRCARPGAPFAVFCPQASPLASASAYLRKQALALNVQLFELWGREYQVLPMRTHPAMSMHGASGFVLTGCLGDGAKVGRTAGVLGQPPTAAAAAAAAPAAPSVGAAAAATTAAPAANAASVGAAAAAEAAAPVDAPMDASGVSAAAAVADGAMQVEAAV